MELSTLIAGLLICFPQPLLADKQCYWPDGSLMDGVPCLSDVDDPPCCAGTSGSLRDMCSANGLCKGPQNGDNVWWRDSCTDPTWQSPNCARYCTTGETHLCPMKTSWLTARIAPDPGANSTFRVVYQCSQTTYCCGYASDQAANTISNFDCCNNASRLFDIGAPSYLAGPSLSLASFGPNTALSTASSSVSPISTTPSATVTNSGTPSSIIEPSAASSNAGLSAGAAAGIGIGATIGVVALVGIAYALGKRQKRSKKRPVTQQEHQEASRHEDTNMLPPSWQTGGEKTTHTEVYTQPAEAGSRARSELEGSMAREFRSRW